MLIVICYLKKNHSHFNSFGQFVSLNFKPHQLEFQMATSSATLANFLTLCG